MNSKEKFWFGFVLGGLAMFVVLFILGLLIQIH